MGVRTERLKREILSFRHKLGLVFDDNLGTRQWYNIVDWVIVFMIILSSVEIFLATLPVGPAMQRVLNVINEVTLWFFIVEVTLRIWAAPEQSPRYRGVMGRVRYCFTFYGFIDLISTYPFLVQYFVPLSVNGLKVLRTARIIRVFRITRFARSFNLLSDSIREKKNELIVSMQFLVIVTFILSIILYVYEHDAQPEVYDNGMRSVIWAFAQYIGDPGQFADTPPVTVGGKIIASLVGILGIAIVAVPAGILGAGFTEAIENEAKKEQLKENREKLRLSFERKLDRPTGFQIVKPYRTLAHIQARAGMTADEIINAVNQTPGFRLVNLAATIPIDKNPQDTLAVEHFEFNKPYGCLIDRNSKVTIVAPSSFIDDCTGTFVWYLAEIGDFNLISREFGKKAPYKSFYTLPANDAEENLPEYLSDLEGLASREGSWIITFLAASGANEPEYDTQVHFGTGNAKGDESTGELVKDKHAYEHFYNDLKAVLKEQFDIECDNGRYHSTTSPNLFIRKISKADDCNFIAMRMAWSVMLWDSRRIKVAQLIAEYINRDLLGRAGNPDNPKLRIKGIGFK